MKPGHKVDMRLSGVASEQFMARTATAILIGQARDLPEPQPEWGRDFVLALASWRRHPKEAIRAHAEKVTTGVDAAKRPKAVALP